MNEKRTAKLLSAVAVLAMMVCAIAIAVPASDAAVTPVDIAKDTDICGSAVGQTWSYDATNDVVTIGNATSWNLKNNVTIKVSQFVLKADLTIIGATLTIEREGTAEKELFCNEAIPTESHNVNVNDGAGLVIKADGMKQNTMIHTYGVDLGIIFNISNGSSLEITNTNSEKSTVQTVTKSCTFN